jgi:hypothetical protein
MNTFIRWLAPMQRAPLAFLRAVGIMAIRTAYILYRFTRLKTQSARGVGSKISAASPLAMTSLPAILLHPWLW